MPEEDRARTPCEEEQYPARNHSAPGLDQCKRDKSTEDFDESDDPEKRYQPGDMGASELCDCW